MKSLPTNYQSYLLRIWQEQDFGTWRASLTNISTRECHAFANMTTLYSFLHEQTVLCADLNKKEIQRKSSGILNIFEPSEEEKRLEEG
jgi:hypothetical protein